jgi:hypothetical protein
MNDKKFQPCELLKPFIKSLAIDYKRKASNYSVWPDANIVVGFQYSGKMACLDNGKFIPLKTA